MTTNDYKIVRQGRIQGGGGGGTVSVHYTRCSKRMFFHKSETRSIPWKTENQAPPFHPKLSDKKFEIVFLFIIVERSNLLLYFT